MSVTFAVDEFVNQLVHGDVEQTHGLVVPCGWSWCEDNPHALQQYQNFAKRLKDIAPDCFYVYKPSEIHCTIATLSSFKEKRSALSLCTPATRRLIMRTWAECIQKQLSSIVNFQRSFELEVVAFEMSDNAGFLLLKDNTGAVAVLRQHIRQAAQAQELRDLEIQLGLPQLELSRLLHVPNIIHSTILRYTAVPDNPSAVYQDAIQIGLGWQPLKVQISRWHLVYEHRPYMHIAKDPTLSVIATYECTNGAHVHCTISRATEYEKEVAERRRAVMLSCTIVPMLVIVLYSISAKYALGTFQNSG